MYRCGAERKNAKAIDEFALKDGFSDGGEMFGWFSAEYPGKSLLDGIVIKWTDEA